MEILGITYRKNHTFQPAKQLYRKVWVFCPGLLLLVGYSLCWGFKPPSTQAGAPPGESGAPREKLLLESPPVSWGLPISGSWGEIRYRQASAKPFLIDVKLKGLSPNHKYVVSLIGKSWHKSSRLLPKSYGKEKYYDVSEITTNSDGNLEKQLIVDLPSGQYNVKFFLRDPSSKWKAVLYNDFFIFTIK